MCLGIASFLHSAYARACAGFALTGCLLLTVPCEAQSGTAATKLTYTTARDAQALAYLAACQAALGNPTDSIGIVAQGSSSPNRTGAEPQSITFESGGIGLSKLIRTTTAGTFTATMGRNHASLPGNGTPQIVPIAGARYQHASLLPIHLCSATALQPEQSVTFVGVENDTNRPLVHLRISAEAQDASGNSVQHIHDISVLDIWLDQSTALPVESRSFAFPSARSMSRFVDEIYYSNFQQSSGFMLPQTVEEHIAGNKMETITWASFTIQQFSASEFIVGGAR